MIKIQQSKVKIFSLTKKTNKKKQQKTNRHTQKKPTKKNKQKHLTIGIA